MEEIEATNMRSLKSDRLEVRATNKPLFDNRDMCGIMCIICAALITYLLFSNGQIVYYGKLQLAGTIVSVIFAIFMALFWLTQQIVKFCSRKAQRKATDKVGD